MRIKDFLKLFSTSITAGLPAALSFQVNAGQIDTPSATANVENQDPTPIQFQDTLNNAAENLYAAHSSHSSHASHASHSSHYSGSGGGYNYSPPPATVTTPEKVLPQTSPETMYDKKGNAYICTPQESGPPICQPAEKKQDYKLGPREPIRFESHNDLDGVDETALARVVLRVQIALKLRGLYLGALTKQLNQESRDVIRQFQKSNELNQEGYLNIETLDALGVYIG